MNDTQNTSIECCYPECRISFIVMLNVIMLSDIMLSVVMLSVFMLSVIMKSVAMLIVRAPFYRPQGWHRQSLSIHYHD
jgi:hypothetical protein